MKALTAGDLTSAAMAQVSAGFAANASTAVRTTAVLAIAKLHDMYVGSTNSIAYDPTLKEFGRNVKKDVRIGPSAFEQDHRWLAGIVYHELVHSDQFDIYAKNGIELPASEARNETERRLVALDEAEAFYRTWEQSGTFKLSKAQAEVVYRRVIHKLIDVDDEAAKKLAVAKKWAEARMMLIGKLKKKP